MTFGHQPGTIPMGFCIPDRIPNRQERNERIYREDAKYAKVHEEDRCGCGLDLRLGLPARRPAERRTHLQRPVYLVPAVRVGVVKARRKAFGLPQGRSETFRFDQYFIAELPCDGPNGVRDLGLAVLA